MMGMVILVLSSILAILFILKWVKYDIVLNLSIIIGLVVKLIEVKKWTINELLVIIFLLVVLDRGKLEKIKTPDNCLGRVMLFTSYFAISFFLIVEVLSTIGYCDKNSPIPYPAVVMILFWVFILERFISYCLRPFVEENENKELIKRVFLKYKTYDSL